MRGARPLLLLVGVLFVAAVIPFSGAAFERVGGTSALSVARVYQGVERELRRHDGIYRVSIEAMSDFGMFSQSGTITRWADVRRDVSREEWKMTPPSGSSVRITTRDGRYWRDGSGSVTTSPSRYWTCNGVGIAASAVLGCPGPTERSTADVREGTYERRSTIVLITTGTVSGSDESYRFTRRLHLDPGTFLPIALEGDGQFDMGTTMPAKERYRFQHRFVPSAEVAKDLFDPASIGYAAVDVAQALDRASPGLQVFWLGKEFAAASGLPALVLSKIDAPDRGPGYRFLLYYAPRDDRYAPALATLQLWPRAAWEGILHQGPFGHMWDDPCWSREELSLPDGRAVIFSGFSGDVVRMPAAAASGVPCPSRPFETFLAHVYLADSVVMVSAPRASGVGGMTTSPFDTRYGIEALVRGLSAKR
jgi:hypothetical protein